jgi:hypothetical protein
MPICCSFWPIIGHIVSKDGIAVDPKKIVLIVNFPRPTTVK